MFGNLFGSSMGLGYIIYNGIVNLGSAYIIS